MERKHKRIIREIIETYHNILLGVFVTTLFFGYMDSAFISMIFFIITSVYIFIKKEDEKQHYAELFRSCPQCKSKATYPSTNEIGIEGFECNDCGYWWRWG